MLPRRREFISAAFTLVELLVVIGIITALIAILLPALSGAREHANRVKCLATLRTMAQAAQMHASEHRGYMPLAGMLTNGMYPDRVGDAAMKKYTYYKEGNREDDGPEFAPAPLTASLGQYMNLPVKLGNRQQLQESIRPESVFRHFTCPSDQNPQTGSSIAVGSWRGPEEVMSYLFNMAFLGLMPDEGGGLGGHVVGVRRPSEVFLFADGQGGVPHGYSHFGVLGGGDTLYDYWLVIGRPGGAFPNLDHIRHRNRINVVFVDGHAETLMLPRWGSGAMLDQSGTGDLERVGIFKGIYK